MITKRIPYKYNIDDIKISTLIYESTGKTFPITFTPSSRILKIDAELSIEELQKLKADILIAVEEVEDL